MKTFNFVASLIALAMFFAMPAMAENTGSFSMAIGVSDDGDKSYTLYAKNNHQPMGVYISHISIDDPEVADSMTSIGAFYPFNVTRYVEGKIGGGVGIESSEFVRNDERSKFGVTVHGALYVPLTPNTKAGFGYSYFDKYDQEQEYILTGNIQVDF